MVHTFSYWGHFLGQKGCAWGLCSAMTLEKDSAILSISFSFHRQLVATSIYHRYHLHIIGTSTFASYRKCSKKNICRQHKTSSLQLLRKQVYMSKYVLLHNDIQPYTSSKMDQVFPYKKDMCKQIVESGARNMEHTT